MEWGEREWKAAAMLRECRAALAAAGTTVVRAVVGADPRAAADWRHYPDGEVYDPGSHVQYFYHRHPAAAAVRVGGARPAPHAPDPDEHGHFHLFLRGEGIPAGIAPLLLPEAAVANAPAPRQSAPLKRGGRDEVCHLVAIAVNASGEPVRLFTTNRWVTGETWYRAADVIAMLDRVRIQGGIAASPVDRWVEGLVRLFQPEIAALLRQRDQSIADWRWRWPRGNAFEDTRLEIMSGVTVDLDARLAEIERRAARPPAAVRTALLPTMAEGWGA